MHALAENDFSILGLLPTASWAETRRAFLSLSRATHDDKGGTGFREVKGAYDRLRCRTVPCDCFVCGKELPHTTSEESGRDQWCPDCRTGFADVYDPLVSSESAASSRVRSRSPTRCAGTVATGPASEHGTVVHSNRKRYGFVRPDNAGGDDANNLLILPSDCVAFGLRVPHVGARIIFDRGVDVRGKVIATQVRSDSAPSSSSVPADVPAELIALLETTVARHPRLLTHDIQHLAERRWGRAIDARQYGYRQFVDLCRLAMGSRLRCFKDGADTMRMELLA